MRRLLVLIACALLAGCGSSHSGASPSATPHPTAVFGYTDPSTRVSVRVVRQVSHPTYALLLVSMRNSSGQTFQPSVGVQFEVSALAEPNSHGTVGVCDADNSQGPGLVYSSVPAHSTVTGWIRCGYTSGSHVYAVFWLTHGIGTYRIGTK
jgi:hypothetical protein